MAFLLFIVCWTVLHRLCPPACPGRTTFYAVGENASNVKVKLTQEQAIKAQRRSKGSSLSLTSTTHRCGWSTPRPGIGTRYPLHRRLGGPQGRSGRVRKISPAPGFDSRTVQPVASRYTDWAVPVTSLKHKHKKYSDAEPADTFDTRRQGTVLPTFLYGSENWTLTASQRRKTEAAEMKLLRPLAGYTLHDHKTNDHICRELQITGILDTMDGYRRNWLLHLQRMPQNRIPLKWYHYRPQGRWTIGRPKKRWREQL